jgi:hypothetical protein
VIEVKQFYVNDFVGVSNLGVRLGSDVVIKSSVIVVFQLSHHERVPPLPLPGRRSFAFPIIIVFAPGWYPLPLAAAGSSPNHTTSSATRHQHIEHQQQSHQNHRRITLRYPKSQSIRKSRPQRIHLTSFLLLIRLHRHDISDSDMAIPNKPSAPQQASSASMNEHAETHLKDYSSDNNVLIGKLNKLLDEILNQIYKSTNRTDLLNLAATCKHFARPAERILWEVGNLGSHTKLLDMNADSQDMFANLILKQFLA